jgi:Ser/Thr protein kinase RdoA (MazF antagonist)
MILPDHAGRSRREIDLLLEGYEQFREFDYSSLQLIEPLRFMRIIYYLTWCARQLDDYDFRANHPDWGSENFWHREIGDIGHQFQVIMEHKVAWEEGRFFGE